MSIQHTNAREGHQGTPRNAALVAIVGTAVFVLITIFLSLLQYNFWVRMGWVPLASFGVLWPNGLALGPMGWLQSANYIIFGLALIVFAVGLHRGVARAGRSSPAGPALLILSGFAALLMGFDLDPDLFDEPRSWHGLVHGLGFFLFVSSSLLSLLFWWPRFWGNPLWRGHGSYTLATGLICLILFFSQSPLAYQLFLAAFLMWIVATAVRLRSGGQGASATPYPRVR